MKRIHATLLALACAGCSEAEPEEEGPKPRFSSLHPEVFVPRCSLASCHSVIGRAGNLVLEGDGAHAALVGVTPMNGAAAQEGLVLVAPGDPMGSFLLLKVMSGLDPRYGDVMPQNSTGLEPDVVAVIDEWISAGAAND